ncbi:hypothetical protein V2I01_18385 [Micromonospora sp. BRA006-A]|nr:hypothetical protein [Micromonospora sp. BRA006-A]
MPVAAPAGLDAHRRGLGGRRPGGRTGHARRLRRTGPWTVGRPT